jgi:hypothetical protein
VLGHRGAIVGGQVGDPGVAGGRLTLTTAVPVTTADVTGAGTIYYTPYIGNYISLFDGANWITHTFTEKSLALTATDAKNYDVFMYNNAGTLTMELSAAWATDTTRTDAIVLQNGVYVKSGATTRRYLGTFRASGSNVTEDSVTKRFVWNYQNRTQRCIRKGIVTTTWAYTTGAWRYSNNDSTFIIGMVCGLNEDSIHLINSTIFNSTNVGVVTAGLGVSLDSGTAPSGTNIYVSAYGSGVPGYTASSFNEYPGVGYHFLASAEYGALGMTFFSLDGAYGGMNGHLFS